MTTHDRDKLIAAAIEAGFSFDPSTGQLYVVDGYDETICTLGIERFYAIAFEDGRQAEREYRPGYAGATIWIGENLVSSIVTKVKIDHEIEKGQAITNATQWCLDQLAIRARGDTK